ncbi:hypothetical protein ACFVDF_004552 [Salmonella enterica]|nr:hypothetical protein [Salmonella enterica]ELQ8786361.1 hypothetical protein [Salmonella enterica]
MESVVQPLKNIQGEVLQRAKGWGCRWGNLPVLARYRIGTFAPVPIRSVAGNRFFANRNLLQRRVEQATQPGKTDVLFNSRVTGTDTTSPDKLRCNVAMNVATGDWTLTQNIGIGFNYCDAVCFK